MSSYSATGITSVVLLGGVGIAMDEVEDASLHLLCVVLHIEMPRAAMHGTTNGSKAEAKYRADGQSDEYSAGC